MQHPHGCRKRQALNHSVASRIGHIFATASPTSPHGLEKLWTSARLAGRYTASTVRISPEKFALPVTWVRGIKLRLFAFSSVAASHDSFATGLRSERPIFVLPLLRENKTPGCPIQGFSKMTLSSLQAP